MPTPQPRYGSRHSKTALRNPRQSRWTARRKALAALPTGGTPPPSHDYQLTGTLTPDITGYYDENGTYNGRSAYQHAPAGWWLWWDGSSFYIISATKGVFGNFWVAVDADTITGLYIPQGTVTGLATASTA